MNLNGYDLSALYLEALHHYGYTVTIHSPRTSRAGLYDVTAYGLQGEQYSAKAVHLTDAIQQVAARLVQAGGGQ